MIVAKEFCHICGKLSEFNINENAVLLREAKCINCGASLRNSDVAEEIINHIAGEGKGLIEQKKLLGKYNILNTCSSGFIHNALKDCKNYICCEFFTDVPSGVYYDNVLCVDLCNIPFKDNTFDMIISEDVLEHINDYENALKEILRVLKPGGKHIFTVPIHEAQKTLSRKMKNNVYHGDPLHEEGCLVVTDWGNDIEILLKNLGYLVETERKHIFYKAHEITNVDQSYEEYLRKKNKMEDYFKYNSIVINAIKPSNNQSINDVFTGERFVPGIGDTQLEIEHYQRYFGVQELVRDKFVLDAACGEGYGSNLLAQTANRVIGLDISKDAINRAKENYVETRNLIFELGSIEQLPFTDNSIDIVISFETIEHVSEDIQIKFLNEINRVLKKDGILVMSTPNKEIYSDLYEYKNEYHIKEFYKHEFEKFLGSKFKNIKLYNQYFEVVSIVDNIDNNEDKVKYFKDSEKYNREGKYYIAIASNEKLPNKSISSVFMNEKAEYDEKIQRIFQLQEAEEIRNNHLKELDKEIENKNSYILKLQKENQECESLRIICEQKVNEINEIFLKKTELEQEKTELEQEKTQLEQEKIQLALEKNQLIQEKNEIVQEKNQIEESSIQFEQEVILRGEHILKLDNEINYLREYRIIAESELNSRTYRISLKFRDFSFKLLPKNSWRRFILLFLIKTIRHPISMIRIYKQFSIKQIYNIIKQEGNKGLKVRFEKAEKRKITNIYSSQYKLLEIEKSKTEKAIDEYQKLEFIKYEEPIVSVIIPVYNQFDFTYKCLKSILDYSNNISYEIIIANDNSSDFTKNIDDIISNINVINNKSNLKFLKNCNNASKYAKGKYILFLNNDTQVQENWLYPLLDVMEKDSKVGLTGSKLIFSDGCLQEAGGIAWNDGSAWNFGNRENPESAEYNYVKEVDFISGACIMIRKSLWNQIGGFDEKFAPAYYEDVDLAFQVRQQGFKVVYQPLSRVVHFEGISNGTDTGSGQKAYQVINQEKFYQKWGEILQRENFPNGKDIFLAKDRSRFKKHILVVDHYVPHFDKDAGGRGTFMYLKLFVEMGMHVTFIGDNFFKHEPYTTLINQEGIEVLYGEYYLNNYQTWIKQNGKYFDYIYLQRPHIAIKYIDLVKKYTNAKIIYYDVDLCHIREMRQYEITKDESLLISAKKWKEIEFGLIEKADVVHVVGSYEENYLKKEFPYKTIRNIPLYIYSDIKKDVSKEFNKRKDILFVGGFGHPPNEDAVLWFAQNVFPAILDKYPDIKWYIVGSKPPESVRVLASENIIIKGFVSDEELNGLYSKCKLDIVPLRYGAGVKGKVLEAIYNQIPLVTTSIGSEGLSKEEAAYWIVDEASEMIDLIVSIYSDNKKLLEKSENCKAFIKNHFMLEEAKRILNMDLY